MSPLAKRQFLQAFHPHYLSAPRTEKTKILDALTKATGYHRKYAVRLLHHGPPPSRPRRRAWVRYGVTVIDALSRLWEASGGLCSKRLRPFLGPLLEALQRCVELRLPPLVKDALLQMSPATIDRNLAPYRRRPKPRGLTTTRPGSLLEPHIPVHIHPLGRAPTRLHRTGPGRPPRQVGAWRVPPQPLGGGHRDRVVRAPRSAQPQPTPCL